MCTGKCIPVIIFFDQKRTADMFVLSMHQNKTVDDKGAGDSEAILYYNFQRLLLMQ